MVIELHREFDDRAAGQRAELLADLASELSLAAEGLTPVVGRWLSDRLGCVDCLILEVEDEADRIRAMHTWRRDEAPEHIGPHRLSDCLPREICDAARAGAVCAVADNAVASETAKPDLLDGLRSFVATPYRRDGSWRSLLLVGDARPRAWSESEIGLIRAAAAMALPRMEAAGVEALLKESEARLAAVLEALPAGLAIADKSGKVTHFNEAIARIWGKPPVPESFAEYENWNARLAGTGEPLSPADWAMSRAIRTGETIHGDILEIERADGGRAVIVNAAAPIKDASGTIIGGVIAEVDITAQKEAEDALRATLESIADGFFSVDAEWRFIYVNAMAERMLRIDRKQALGKSHWEVFPQSVGTSLEREYRAAAAGELRDFEVYYAPWGRWFHFRCFPRAGGGLSVYFQDVTERKKAEEELRQSREAFETIVNCIPAAVNLMGDDLRVRLINPAYQAIAPGKEMLGRTLEEIWPEVGVDLTGLCRRVLETGKEHHVDDDFVPVRRRADGPIEPAYFSWSLHRVRLPGDQGWGVLNTAWETTERKRAEGALRESEQRFRQVVQSLPQMVWTCGPQGDCDYLSPQWVDYTGVPESRHLGYGWLDQLHPDDRERVGERWRATMAAGRDLADEFRIRRRDGEYRWFRTLAVPLRDGAGAIVKWFGSNTDITDSKHAEAARRESEERFARFMRHLPGLAWIKDIQGRYVYVNDAAEKAFQRPRGQLYGKTDDEIFPLETAAQFRANDQKALASDAGVAAIETLKEDDGVVHHSVVSKFAIRDSDGALKGTGGVAIDVTERVETERRLREATAKLKEADRRKDEFLATLAHELRNPLAAIHNGLQVSLKTKAREPAARMLDIMARQVDHLVRLVDDLLEVSRISTGKIALKKETLDLGSVLNHAVDMTHEAVEKSGLELRVSLPKERLLLHGDPVRLVQVFSNLLNNAAKYTNPGGRVDVVAARLGDEAVVTVSDTGAGISAEMLPRVFDLFAQVHVTLGRARGGLGIGLALVRNLVRLHHGAVEAHSAGEGQGSQFVVRLPLAGH